MEPAIGAAEFSVTVTVTVTDHGTRARARYTTGLSAVAVFALEIQNCSLVSASLVVSRGLVRALSSGPWTVDRGPSTVDRDRDRRRDGRRRPTLFRVSPSGRASGGSGLKH